PIHDFAGSVAEKSAVGVAVEGYAKIELAFHFRNGLADVFGMKCSAILINVFSIGLGVQEGRLNAAGMEQFGRFGGRRPVGAIDENFERTQVSGDVMGQPINVSSPESGISRQAGIGAGWSFWRRLRQPSEDFVLNGEFTSIGQFIAVAGENFNAIVGPRIVGGRDYDAGIEFSRAREIGYTGSGNHTGAFDPHPAGGKSDCHSIRNPVARLTSVLANHNAGTRIGTNQIMPESPADGIRVVQGKR